MIVRKIEEAKDEVRLDDAEIEDQINAVPPMSWFNDIEELKARVWELQANLMQKMAELIRTQSERDLQPPIYVHVEANDLWYVYDKYYLTDRKEIDEDEEGLDVWPEKTHIATPEEVEWIKDKLAMNDEEDYEE